MVLKGLLQFLLWEGVVNLNGLSMENFLFGGCDGLEWGNVG